MSAIKNGYELMHERLGLFPGYNWPPFMETPAPETTAPERGSDPVCDVPISRTPAWYFAREKTVVLSSKPVAIRLTRDEGLCLAESEKLGIIGTGESVIDAFEDFGEQLVHQFLHYKRLDPRRGTGRALELKQIYEDLFEEVAFEG